MSTGIVLEFLNMGGSEIMLILAVVLLLFGGKKLPELARGLGQGIRDFKDASEGVKREIHRNINAVGLEEDPNAPVAAAEVKPTLEEQMYPKTEVKEPINLTKEVVVEHTAVAVPVEHTAAIITSETPETEKNKI
ncbi:twin-arginine translocase TatA/TatE family subunit [Pedobacter sp. L105]|uniref:Sec-independent protein translocase subunit TatA/TatB n=1 Tax=Pedobacter sp. L105 TaxID=1641871 RepID=UPI0020B12CA6|nr:twin-arginine translocase TatA/TatE family subunit [Pedobacter sp. L105]